MSDQFQHIMVLMSIIVGLGITHLLAGVTDGIDRANDEDRPQVFSVLVVLWAATVFCWMVNFWWFQFRLLSMVQTWSIGRYFFMILYSVALYTLAVILVPRDWDRLKSTTEHFMRNRHWFFIAFLFASIADVTDSYLKGGWAYVVGIGPFNNLTALATIPVFVIGIRSRRVRTQTILAAVYFALYFIGIFEYTPVLIAA